MSQRGKKPSSQNLPRRDAKLEQAFQHAKERYAGLGVDSPPQTRARITMSRMKTPFSLIAAVLLAPLAASAQEEKNTNPAKPGQPADPVRLVNCEEANVRQ